MPCPSSLAEGRPFRARLRHPRWSVVGRVVASNNDVPILSERRPARVDLPIIPPNNRARPDPGANAKSINFTEGQTVAMPATCFARDIDRVHYHIMPLIDQFQPGNLVTPDRGPHLINAPGLISRAIQTQQTSVGRKGCSTPHCSRKRKREKETRKRMCVSLRAAHSKADQSA